jgi:hypothetical protein
LLVCISTIGIILSTYAADNLFEAIFGKTFALELVPDAQIVSETFTDSSNYNGSSFTITVGFIIVLFISLMIFAFDFEKHLWF